MIESIVNSGSITYLYIVDNSPNWNSKFKLSKYSIIYIKNTTNIGFGAGHNIAINDALIKGSLFHFVVNPDIRIEKDVIMKMIESMNENPNIGLMMPRILNSDGSIQYLPKLLPSPLSILIRKVNRLIPIFQKYVSDYELRGLSQKGLFDAPIVSGCFSVIRSEAIKEVGLFDERFFMYFEDWDLSRRVAMKYRTVINNSISVVHEYNSEANKSIKLFFIFIKSALSYFFKWGFFFDHDSKLINQKVLRSIKNV